MRIFVTGAALVLAYVARLLALHTVAIVEARRLLPRWDLATHLERGWLDYHFLVTGQIHRLLWDLWLQGYWPPMLSLYQIPFYVVLGGTMGAGLWSAIIAFVLVGLVGCVVLWRQYGEEAVAACALFVALLISSPFLLAYGAVTMTETFGALVQLVVLLAYVDYERTPSPRAARLFALSLTALFFTKYNYFFMLAAPLVACEWLKQPRRWPLPRRALWSPVVVFVLLYLVALVAVLRTGGFDLTIAGHRVSVHTIGNSGHVVLYLLLARLWYLHARGRIDWSRVFAADPRVRPLLLWFVLPVTIWMASPYPNHIRDFFNLVVNRPLESAGVDPGVSPYLDALTNAYFFVTAILVFVTVALAAAAVTWRRQPVLVQVLVLAVVMQGTAIALHQTRFPRFLLLTVVLACLGAAAMVGQWVTRLRVPRLVTISASVLVLAAGAPAARAVVNQPRFSTLAFELYTRHDALRAAIDAVGAELTPADRLAVVGQGNLFSPALFRWELGPPSGHACYPFELAGARGVPLAAATRVLLLDAMDEGPLLDRTPFYPAQRAAVLAEAARGELTLTRDIRIPDLRVSFKLFTRTRAPEPSAPCE